ncbi:hypothetical protein ALC62_11750, partial [Cyphomyrmex costatus]
TLDHLPVSLVLTFSVIAVSGLFTEGNLVCVQARVAGQGRHTHLRNNNAEVSDGVHPISAAAAAGRASRLSHLPAISIYLPKFTIKISIVPLKTPHQPSLELFMCFLPDGGPLQPIDEKPCFLARAIINTRGNVEASSHAALRGTEEPAAPRSPNGKGTALMNYETDRERRGRYRGERTGAGLRARARLISQSEPKNSGAIKRGEAVLRCGRL